MRLARLIYTSAVLLLLAPTAGLAQDGQVHQGFWIGFGIGGGSVKVDGSDESTGGGAAYLRLGGTLSQKWMIGGEAMFWGRSEDGVSYSRSNTTFTTMFYPGQKGGFYLKGGLGFSYVSVGGDVSGINISADKGGVGTTFGVGWDIRLGRNIYLTPNIDWLFQTIEVSEGTNQNANALLITLGLIWH